MTNDAFTFTTELQDWVMAAFDVLEEADLAVTTSRIEILAYLSALTGNLAFFDLSSLFTEKCLQRFLPLTHALGSGYNDERLSITWANPVDLYEGLIYRRIFSERFIGGANYEKFQTTLRKLAQITDLTTTKATVYTTSALQGIINGEPPCEIMQRAEDSLYQINTQGYRFAKKFLPGTLDSIATLMLETPFLAGSSYLVHLQDWFTIRACTKTIPSPKFGLDTCYG